MPLADLAPFARDMLFYQKRKKEKCRLVSPPKFDAPIADTHAHLDMLGIGAGNCCFHKSMSLWAAGRCPGV